MEDTYALLSNLVQTKSIERALAPIAAQVSQLIIQNEAYETGDKEAFPADLVPSATCVMQSSDKLVQAARRLSNDSVDEELKVQMPKACDLLCIAGQSLVTAAQRVHMEDFNHDSRRHLVRTAKDVLEGTLKVLLVSDDAEVRKIVRSAHWVKDRLGVLTAVKTMKHLVPCFKAFTEALMLLTNLADKRQIELTNAKQREHVISSMTTLKKCVPMLNSAMQTYVKYNDSAQASQSKEYVLGQILQCLDDMCLALENKEIPGSDDIEPEEPGHFVTNIDKVIDYLSEESRHEMAALGSDFDLITEAAIRHSMAVAHVSSETHRTLIIKNCQRVLRQRTHLSDLSKSVSENPSFTELSADFDDESERLIEEFQDLERHVNASVLQLIVDVFKETTEPVERLVKAAMSSSLPQDEDLMENALKETLTPYIEAFHDHSDKMCQIARCAAASSPDAKRVRDIRSCATQLEQLDPELVPACIACYKNRSNKASLEHLRLIKTEWANNVQLMVDTIDGFTDSKLFIQVAEVEMIELVHRCKESLYSDPIDLAGHSRALIGHGRRVHHMACRLVDVNHDPIFRNGVMVYVTQLNKAIPSVKSGANRLVGEIGEVKYHESFHRRCDILLKCVGKLRLAIDGKIHPQLMDPVRENARPLEGIKSLGLNPGVDYEYDPDEDKENMAAATNIATKQRANDKEDDVKKKVAMKHYISDIVNSQLAELAREVVSSAVAGRQKRVNTLCTDVLTRSNHIADIASSIAACVLHETQRETLEDCAKEITDMTPHFLDKASKVVDCDTYQIDPLHEVSEKWISRVSFLESYVDGLIDRWKKVSDKVVDATKMGNVRLLTAQVRQLNEHSRFVQDLTKALNELVDSGDVYMIEKALFIKESADEFSNCSTLLTTMADVTVNSGKSDDKIQIELQGREWASKVYCITRLVFGMAKSMVEKMTGKILSDDFENEVQVNEEIKDITEITIRLKDLARTTSEVCPDVTKKEQILTLVVQLDTLLGHMSDCGKLLQHITAPYQTTEKLYAPQSLRLLQWEWAQKCEKLQNAINSVTSEFRLSTTKMLSTATTVRNTPEGLERDAERIQFRRAKDEFRNGFMKARANFLDAIQMTSDVDKKSNVRKHIEELGQLADEIEKAGKQVAEEGDANDTFRDLEMQWATKLCQLTSLLNGIQDVNKSAVKEAMTNLKPSAPKLTSSKMHETGKSFVQFIEPDTSTSTRLSPGNRGASRTNTPSSATRSQASINLSGSLLDFADDLCPEVDDTVGDSTFKDSLEPSSDEDESNISVVEIRSPRQRKVTFHVPRRREFMDVSSSMWFDEEYSSDSSACFYGGTPSAGITTIDSVDKSWKELSKGPKVQHTTPSRSVQRSTINLPRRGVHSKGLAAFEDKWEDENNAVVRVAKEITRKVSDMEEFMKDAGPLESKEALFHTAKDVAKNAETLVKFARAMVDLCIDPKLAANLKTAVEHVPTVIAQLHILSMVKEATPDDRTNEKMVIKTANNLVDALSKMLGDVEAACVKGLRQPPSSERDATETIVLAAQWKRKFERHRMLETSTASTDDLGLRKVDRNVKAPHLTQIMLQR